MYNININKSQRALSTTLTKQRIIKSSLGERVSIFDLARDFNKVSEFAKVLNQAF